MSLFNFSIEEILSFFAVLVRFSVLIAVLPVFGDRFIPASLKVLFAFSVSIALFPILVSRGEVRPGEAIGWGATAGGIVSTIGLEALFGLVLGFTGKLAFDSINFGSNLMGYFMGLGTASIYDPNQETQTQVVAEVHMAIAMLVFLVLDGHHQMLRASLSSYQVVGLGQAGIGTVFAQKLISITAQVLRIGIQLAAPMAISLFAVNLMFGIMAKAMPQLHVLILSFGASVLVGFCVLLLGMPEFQRVAGTLLEKSGDWIEVIMLTMKSR
jgi:flagellar biosynthesis protein FliR